MTKKSDCDSVCQISSHPVCASVTDIAAAWLAVLLSGAALLPWM
jgi:hypothetical protein